MVEILAGHHTGEVVPVLSVDRDGVREIRLADGAVAYYDSWEVRTA